MGAAVVRTTRVATRSNPPKPKYKIGDRVCDLDGARAGRVTWIASYDEPYAAFTKGGVDYEAHPGWWKYKVQQDAGPNHHRNEPNLRRCTAAENRAAKARKNPGFADYVSVGRRAAARAGAAVAGQARILAEQARHAAALEADRRRPSEPTVAQAITVLARAHGVKVNPKKLNTTALLARLDELGFPSLAEDIGAGGVRLSDALRDLASNERSDERPKAAVYKRAREIVHLLLAPQGARANPRAVVSDDKAIEAFLAKREAKSKQLSSTGTELSLHWPRAVVAEWLDNGKIQLGIAYGNVSQSYIMKVARRAPAYLLTADSYWALPAKTVKLLKSEGRDRANPYGARANPRKLLGWNTTQGKVTRGYLLVDPPSGRSPWWTITKYSGGGATYFEVERDGEELGSKGTLGLAKDLAEQDAQRLLAHGGK